MTSKEFKKTFSQLKRKPVKLKKYVKHCSPKKRSCGLANRKCSRCGRTGGHIKKYGMNICRHCFRETAQDLGFKKFR